MSVNEGLRLPMMARKRLVVLLGVLLLAGAWFLFRPERLFVNSYANDAPLPASAKLLASGTFTSDAHETTGKVHLYEDGDNKFVRLSNFETSNGPDVHVVLVEGKEPGSANSIDLGALKGNIGDQNYEIPAGTDISRFGAVSIWCKRFSVNFGDAKLS
jgi:hypothetical protein